MKKVLITGARGFVGSALVNNLKKDYEVVCINRGDDLITILDHNPNYVIHCAAEIYKPELMFDTNVTMTYDILTICKKLPNLDNFVYIGSSSEYGRKSHPIQESDNLEPETMYEGTKACGTMLTKVFGKSFNMMTSIVRPFSLYGPGESNHKFIPFLYKCFTEDLPIKIGSGVHDWLYIDDFVNGVKLVMTDNYEPGEVFHFGTGEQHTNLEVLKTFESIYKYSIDHTLVENVKTAGVDSDSWVASIKKVYYKLGWSPKYNLVEGIDKYIKYRENGNVR